MRTAVLALALLILVIVSRRPGAPADVPGNQRAAGGVAVHALAGHGPPALAREDEPVADTSEDRLTVLLTSCEPDARVLSLPERRQVPVASKAAVREVLERSRLRAREAIGERYAALLGRPVPDRASAGELLAELWAVLAPEDRARAADAIGGGAPSIARLRGIDTLLAALDGEPARAFDELRTAVGTAAAEEIWSADVVSWCALTLPL